MTYQRVISRLNALLLVLKSCKGDTCRQPWLALHPSGKVRSLAESMSPEHNSYYAAFPIVQFASCARGMGYLRDNEAPFFRDIEPEVGSSVIADTPEPLHHRVTPDEMKSAIDMVPANKQNAGNRKLTMDDLQKAARPVEAKVVETFARLKL